MHDYFDPTPSQAETAKRMFLGFLRHANQDHVPLDAEAAVRADQRLMAACLRAACGALRTPAR